MAHTAKCRGKKRDGSRCQAKPVQGSDYCFFHAPNRKKQRKEAQSEGGKGGRTPRPVLPADAPERQIKDVGSVVELLADAINGVQRGALDCKIANTTGFLANVLLRALEGAEVAKRIEELSAELDALRVEIEAKQRERRRQQSPIDPEARGGESAPRGHGDEPDIRNDPGGPSPDIPPSGDDAGPLAGDIAPFFQ